MTTCSAGRSACGYEAPVAVWVFRSGRRGALSTWHTPRFSYRRRLSRAPPRGFTQPGAKPTRSAQPRKMARVFAARSTVHCSARLSSSSSVTPHRTSSSRGSAATCGLGEESPPWSLPQDGSKPAVRSWRREGSNGQRQTPDSPHPCPSTAHGSPGDVGEVAPLTENDAGSQVQNPEGTACPVVVGPVSPASRLSSPDAFCCNQVGWRCPSRCRS